MSKTLQETSYLDYFESTLQVTSNLDYSNSTSRNVKTELKIH